MSEATAQRPWRLYAFVLLLAALFAAAWWFDLSGPIARGIEVLRGWGPVSLVFVAVFYIVACVLMIPGSMLTIGAGFLAGVFWPDNLLLALGFGYLACGAGSVAGASAAFLLGRTLARGPIERRMAGNARFQAISRAIERDGFKIVLLVRLSPAFPFTLLNYALGLTRVTFRDYLLASAIGMVPGTLLYVYIGTAAQSVATASGDSVGWPRIALMLAGLAATVAVVVLVTRIARRELAESNTEEAA